MNLQHLKSFVVLAETGSFREASQRLAIAQPTLSQHIKKLEETLGARLFERGRAGSELTQKGRMALPMAKAVLSSAQRLERRLKSEDLAIAASGNIASYFLGRTFRELKDWPEIGDGLRILQATNVEAVERLSRREIDMAFTEWRPLHPKIESRPWRTEPMVVIAPPSSPHAEAERISIRDFLDLPMIGGEPGSGTGTLLRETLGKASEALKTVANLGSTEAVKSAVEAGAGYSIVLRGAVDAELAAGRLVALELDGPPLAKTFYASIHQDAPRPSFPRRVLAHLTETRPPES